MDLFRAALAGLYSLVFRLSFVSGFYYISDAMNIYFADDVKILFYSAVSFAWGLYGVEYVILWSMMERHKSKPLKNTNTILISIDKLSLL